MTFVQEINCFVGINQRRRRDGGVRGGVDVDLNQKMCWVEGGFFFSEETHVTPVFTRFSDMQMEQKDTLSSVGDEHRL